MFHRTAPLILATLFAASFGTAAAAEHREHGPHVHGIGHLDVAMEGKTLAIEFTTPAANVLGFEHPPENDEQTARLLEVTELLQDGTALFTLPDAARCTQESADVASELLEEEEHDGEAEHHHGAEEHHEDHVHADFHVSYHFHCAAPASLDTLEVNLFTRFPATERLEVQLITPAGQTARELTPSAARLDF